MRVPWPPHGPLGTPWPPPCTLVPHILLLVVSGGSHQAVGLSSGWPLVRSGTRCLCVSSIANRPGLILTLTSGRPQIDVLDFLGPLSTRGVLHVGTLTHSVEYVLYFIDGGKPLAVILGPLLGVGLTTNVSQYWPILGTGQA